MAIFRSIQASLSAQGLPKAIIFSIGVKVLRPGKAEFNGPASLLPERLLRYRSRFYANVRRLPQRSTAVQSSISELNDCVAKFLKALLYELFDLGGDSALRSGQTAALLRRHQNEAISLMAGNDDGLVHGCVTVSSDIILEFYGAHSVHFGLRHAFVSIWPNCPFFPLNDALSGRW